MLLVWLDLKETTFRVGLRSEMLLVFELKTNLQFLCRSTQPIWNVVLFLFLLFVLLTISQLLVV